MKRSFLLLCAVLLVLGCALPCAAYRLARMTLAQSTAPSAAEASSAASEEGSGQATSPADTADTVCFTDQSTGQAMELPLREYLIGAVAAEMPVSWPDEALKAQAVRRTAMPFTAGITARRKTVHGSPQTPPGGRAA